MAKEQDIKSLERRARAMISGKEIPSSRMDVVRSLLNNESLKPEEKYSSIIDLIKTCPAKKSRKNIQTNSAKNKKNTNPDEESGETDIATEQSLQVADLYTPTETTVYLDKIYRKHRHLKIFKWRYLAHRNNRLGFGIRKRLIPNRKLLRILNDNANLQEKIVTRLSTIIINILEDKETEDPTIFNYLRFLRKWFLDTPLIKYRFEEIKWMERINFEREFRSYATGYFSIKRIEPAIKEKIIEEVENRLRLMDDFQKEEILETDNEQLVRQKDKSNLAKEKMIYEYMMLFRSFLATMNENELPLSVRLKKNWNINNLSELILIIMEALVFQRILNNENMISYYTIEPPSINKKDWDYSEEFLKKVGKDPESRRTDRVSELQDRLGPFDSIALMLNYVQKGQNILMKGAEDQWKFVDKKHYNSRLVYTENFFSFLDSVVNYFNNAFIPILDGSTIFFRDPLHKEYESSLVTSYFMENEISRINAILNEMHYFRSNNPTLAVTWSEVKKIMEGKTTVSAHIGQYVTEIGDVFYKIGTMLNDLLEIHKLWVYNGKKIKDTNTIRKPIDRVALENIHKEEGRPIPFFDSIIIGFEDNSPLSRNIHGLQVLNESMEDGIIINIIAFALQTAHECFNKRLGSDIQKRNELIEKMKKIEKESKKKL